VSYLFDGSGDGIQHANAPSPPPNKFSVIAWIKPTAAVGFDSVHIYFGDDERYGLAISPSGGSATIRFRAPFSVGNGGWVGPGDLLTFNAWQAIAATYDGTSAANDPTFYLKPEGGALSAPAVTEFETPSGTLGTANNQQWTGGVIGAYVFSGYIAYVRVFEGVLHSAAEI
jgi:hypothetical protein